MNVILDASALADALQPVARVFGRSEAAATLLIRVDDAIVTVSAHNGEFGMERSVAGTVVESGQARVDGKMFVDFIKTLPKGPLQLALADGQLGIAAGDIEVQLRTIAVEHPLSVTAPNESAVAIDCEAFVEVATHVEKAASRDESRPMLTGILVTVQDGALTMVATDSYRLSVSRAQLVDGDWEALVPARALVELVKLAQSTGAEQLYLEQVESNLRVRVGAYVVNSRLIAGAFPDYRKLVPTAFSHEVTLESEQILTALTRMAVIGGGNIPIRFEFSEEGLHIGVEGGDVGRGGERIDCAWSGEPMTVAYNLQYLREGLQLVGAQARLQIVDEIKPSLLVRPDDENFLYLVMPVRLSV
jgi:DNA polymerase III subunit beta